MTEDFIAGWKAGVLAAAAEVANAWNDSCQLTNQKDQAERSARVLRDMATAGPANAQNEARDNRARSNS